MEKPIPPSEARSDWSYPPEFEQIVLKLLSKNRDERYAHALDVRQALEECLAELKERRDAALDFSPDELADIVGSDDGAESGTDTVRLDEHMVSDLLNDLSDEEKRHLLGEDPELKNESESDTAKEPEPVVSPKEEPRGRLGAANGPPVRGKDSVNLHHVETMELQAQLKKSGSRRTLIASLLGFGLVIAVLVAVMYLN